MIVRLPTIKGHLKCALLLYCWGSGGSEIQSVVIVYRSLHRQNRKEHLSNGPDAIICEHLAAQACCNPDKVDEYAVETASLRRLYSRYRALAFVCQHYRVPDPPFLGSLGGVLGPLTFSLGGIGSRFSSRSILPRSHMVMNFGSCPNGQVHRYK